MRQLRSMVSNLVKLLLAVCLQPAASQPAVCVQLCMRVDAEYMIMICKHAWTRVDIVQKCYMSPTRIPHVPSISQNSPV
jgi:hypothetical protein